MHVRVNEPGHRSAASAVDHGFGCGRALGAGVDDPSVVNEDLGVFNDPAVHHVQKTEIGEFDVARAFSEGAVDAPPEHTDGDGVLCHGLSLGWKGLTGSVGLGVLRRCGKNPGRHGGCGKLAAVKDGIGHGFLLCLKPGAGTFKNRCLCEADARSRARQFPY